MNDLEKNGYNVLNNLRGRKTWIGHIHHLGTTTHASLAREASLRVCSSAFGKGF
jgi:hypothetical protein